MEIQLGRKIRELRLQRDISQEALAAHLHITSQSVSKWENGITMPDVSLIPAIASYFAVTTDELFDYNLYEIESRVEEIVCEYFENRNDPAQAAKILRAGLSQYPGNERLLNCLVYVLPLPEAAEEVLTICRKLTETTRCGEIKYDAYRVMAEAYASMGNFELARVALENIPEIYFSKLSAAALILQGEESFAAADKHMWLAFEDILRMLERKAAYYEETGRKADALACNQWAKNLIEAMNGEPDIEKFGNYLEKIEAEIERLKG